MRILLALVLCAATCVPAFAQEDAEGAKDHPVLARMPGFYLAGMEEQEFAAYDFTVGDDVQAVEGRYWRLEYWLKEGAKNPGALAIARNYSNALIAKKGRKIYEAVDDVAVPPPASTAS